ncbi:unnamed protein product [Fusarium graminearum]|uniref:Uncharacterized protein n=1 Tax=Gibberella zeae TaxID=5518 RepID=A0A9N8WX93_GIBZA|nr:unnamed protein product [Fusarium graminearum]CZS79065.1 unnamed protein product [Fusarium graminearum]
MSEYRIQCLFVAQTPSPSIGQNSVNNNNRITSLFVLSTNIVNSFSGAFPETYRMLSDLDAVKKVEFPSLQQAS